MNLPKTAEVAKVVARMIEAPYRLGGASPEDGFDCLGYLRYFYSSLGYDVPAESEGISSTDYLSAYEADPERCKRALWREILRFGPRVEVAFKQLADLLIIHDPDSVPLDGANPQLETRNPKLCSGIWVGRGNVLSCDVRIGVSMFPYRKIDAQRMEVIRPCRR